MFDSKKKLSNSVEDGNSEFRAVKLIFKDNEACATSLLKAFKAKIFPMLQNTTPPNLNDPVVSKDIWLGVDDDGQQIGFVTNHLDSNVYQAELQKKLENFFTDQLFPGTPPGLCIDLIWHICEPEDLMLGCADSKKNVIDHASDDRAKGAFLKRYTSLLISGELQGIYEVGSIDGRTQFGILSNINLSSSESWQELEVYNLTLLQVRLTFQPPASRQLCWEVGTYRCLRYHYEGHVSDKKSTAMDSWLRVRPVTQELTTMLFTPMYRRYALHHGRQPPDWTTRVAGMQCFDIRKFDFERMKRTMAVYFIVLGKTTDRQ